MSFFHIAFRYTPALQGFITTFILLDFFLRKNVRLQRMIASCSLRTPWQIVVLFGKRFSVSSSIISLTKQLKKKNRKKLFRRQFFFKRDARKKKPFRNNSTTVLKYAFSKKCLPIQAYSFDLFSYSSRTSRNVCENRQTNQHQIRNKRNAGGGEAREKYPIDVEHLLYILPYIRNYYLTDNGRNNVRLSCAREQFLVAKENATSRLTWCGVGRHTNVIYCY